MISYNQLVRLGHAPYREGLDTDGQTTAPGALVCPLTYFRRGPARHSLAKVQFSLKDGRKQFACDRGQRDLDRSFLARQVDL